MMRAEFRLLLLAQPEVAALTDGAVDWGETVQPPAPRYIVLTMVSDNEGVTMQGPDGLQQGRVQVDCYARDYADAVAMGDAVRGLLHGYRGGGFRLILFAGARYPREGGDEVSAIYRASLDFLTHWRSQ